MLNLKNGKYQVGSIEDLMESEFFVSHITPKVNELMVVIPDIPQTQESFNKLFNAFAAGYLFAMQDVQQGRVGTCTLEDLEVPGGKTRSN